MDKIPSVPETLKLTPIVDVNVTDDTLSVDLQDGRTISVPIGWYPRLANGSSAERTHYQISGAGYGIHLFLFHYDFLDLFLLLFLLKQKPDKAKGQEDNRNVDSVGDQVASSTGG